MMVFDSALLDYRLIMVGSLIPWIDFVWGPPWPLHSVFFAVGVMVAVMLIGWDRRLIQRRWLGLPIGILIHLVLAGGFTEQKLFWWPALGLGVDGLRPSTPSFALAVILEAFGLVVAVWLWKVTGMSDPKLRQKLLSTGHIDRERLRG